MCGNKNRECQLWCLHVCESLSALWIVKSNQLYVLTYIHIKFLKSMGLFSLTSRIYFHFQSPYILETPIFLLFFYWRHNSSYSIAIATIELKTGSKSSMLAQRLPKTNWPNWKWAISYIVQSWLVQYNRSCMGDFNPLSQLLRRINNIHYPILLIAFWLQNR